ncbi:hypothetical protein Y032_0049g1831 [Ancylostoma ceylanicum]|uniref:Secreted protein n=1 Tax=Ancylostoma ceylanicum TaxID=53326 RepID=A0A016UB90_9BILA|nr:hypothetical protein Y032_0049g1831 [Ancylostoma ceylanicum]
MGEFLLRILLVLALFAAVACSTRERGIHPNAESSLKPIEERMPRPVQRQNGIRRRLGKESTSTLLVTPTLKPIEERKPRPVQRQNGIRRRH